MNITFTRRFVVILGIGAVIIISALYLGYEGFALEVLDRVLGAE